MQAPANSPSVSDRRSLPAPARLELGALFGLAVIFAAFPFTYYRHAVPMYLVVALITAAAGGLILLRLRWAPALGAVVGLLVTLLSATGLAAMPATTDPQLFSIMAIALLGVTVVVSGVTAAVHSFRGAEVTAPQKAAWAAPVLAGAAAAMVLLGTLAQVDWVTGVTPESVTQLTTINAGHMAFDVTELRVKAGQPVALNLYVTDEMRHTFTIDELGVNANLTSFRNNLVVFTPTAPGTYTYYCAPHYSKATGQGMAGKLIVEP